MATTLPSLEGFHDEILSWNFFGIEHQEFYAGRQVPLRFSSVAEYVSVMDPLLFEEVRATILRAREERRLSKAATSKEHTKSFTVLDARFTKFASHILLSMKQVEPASSGGEALGLSDVVLLSKEGPGNSEQRLHTLGIVDKDLLADSDRASGDAEARHPSWIIRVPGGGTNRGDGVYTSEEDGREKLGYAAVPGTEWLVTKLCSLVTAQREYQALRSVEHLPLPLLHTLLKSTASPTSRRALVLPAELESTMKDEYNASQWRALRAALYGSITLVQGPPGTGKTKTILGLLTVLLNSRDNLRKHCGAAAEREQVTTARPCGRRVDHNIPVYASLGAATPGSAANGGFNRMQAIWGRCHPWLREGTALKASLSEATFDLRGDEGGVTVKRVLVCAPSNAAIDEIAIRMQEGGMPGVPDPRNHLQLLNAVRVGPNVHPKLESISLQHLVRSRGGTGGKGEERERGEVEDARRSILEDAKIVFCTLSSAGTPLFSQLSIGFDTVIVDEAAQAIELSALIPVKYGCQRLIMVGDIAQLPATVLSQVAISHGYDVSLFHRLQKCGFPVWFLRTQYRMHPAISMYPAERFYGNKLVNAEELVEQARKPLAAQQPFYALRGFGPYVFYNLVGSSEASSSTTSSWRNVEEARLAVLLYKELRKRYPDVPPGDIGVITPYKGQVVELRNRFRNALSPCDMAEVEINSIDGFQGREKNIVIFSCVRARKRKGVGFLADERRMNVALTRARFALWIIGSASALNTNRHWKEVTTDAKERNCYIRVQAPCGEELPGHILRPARDASSRGSSEGKETGARKRPRSNAKPPAGGSQASKVARKAEPPRSRDSSGPALRAKRPADEEQGTGVPGSRGTEGEPQSRTAVAVQGRDAERDAGPATEPTSAEDRLDPPESGSRPPDTDMDPGHGGRDEPSGGPGHVGEDTGAAVERSQLPAFSTTADGERLGGDAPGVELASKLESTSSRNPAATSGADLELTAAPSTGADAEVVVISDEPSEEFDSSDGREPDEVIDPDLVAADDMD